MLHTIRDVQLLAVEEKTYFGIRAAEHLCRVNIGGRLETVKLVFAKESCKWTIVEV
ncbi:MAG: hypothetical protein NC131_10115 [Roseburia sp.]|nr:hypothetical protein [Roseburia sp.]